jgi:VWFA-related protein
MTRTLPTIVVAIATVTAGAAQQQTVPGRAEGQQAPPRFNSAVEAVRVPAVVTDGSHAVAGLTAADFELLDSNVPQTIDVHPIEGQPVDVTLVLDVSGSVEGRALAALRADVQTVAESLQPSDRVRLLTFGSTVNDAFGFQSGGAPLPVDRIETGGLTSFYDALAAAIMIDPEIERPQLVFALTDGMDNTSFIDARRIVTLAGTTQATLYLALVDPSQPIRRFDNGTNPLATEQSAIAYDEKSGSAYEGFGVVRRSVGPFKGPPDLASLKAAVARTGGALYEKVSDSLPGRFAKVLEDFRTGYLLSYSPSGVPAPGWHDITVRTKNAKYKTRARAGYVK